jgi:hypothetical protein
VVAHPSQLISAVLVIAAAAHALRIELPARMWTPCDLFERPLERLDGISFTWFSEYVGKLKGNWPRDFRNRLV